jgi:hypothetical protein
LLVCLTARALYTLTRWNSSKFFVRADEKILQGLKCFSALRHIQMKGDFRRLTPPKPPAGITKQADALTVSIGLSLVSGLRRRLSAKVLAMQRTAREQRGVRFNRGRLAGYGRGQL